MIAVHRHKILTRVFIILFWEDDYAYCSWLNSLKSWTISYNSHRSSLFVGITQLWNGQRNSIRKTKLNQVFINGRLVRTRHRHSRIQVQTVGNSITIGIAIERIGHKPCLFNIRQSIPVRIFAQCLHVNGQQQTVFDQFII